MNQRQVLVGGAVAGTALTLIYLFQPLYPGAIGYVSLVATPLLSALAVMSAFGAFRRYGVRMDDRFSVVWFAATLGVFLWLVGEVVYGVYAFTEGGQVPFPSLADVFYLAGYVAVAYAVYAYVDLFKAAMTARRAALVFVTVVAAGALMLFGAVIPAVQDMAGMVPLAVNVTYIVLDMTLLCGAILGFSLFAKGSIARSWFYVLLAIVLIVAGDVLFTYLSAAGLYYNGSPDDLLYLLAYMLAAMGFYSHTKEF